MKTIILAVIILITLSSCGKEEYHILLTGHLYKDCNLTPYVNEKVEVYNTGLGYKASGVTSTDANGYFKIELKGESDKAPGIDATFFIRTLDWQDEVIDSWNVQYYMEENSTLDLLIDSNILTDTVFLTLLTDGYKFGIYKFPPVYQLSPENFISNRVTINFNRKDYKKYYSYPEIASYHLWVLNEMPLKVVWGIGRAQYNESIAQYKINDAAENARILKIKAKACDSSLTIQLY